MGVCVHATAMRGIRAGMRKTAVPSPSVLGYCKIWGRTARVYLCARKGPEGAETRVRRGRGEKLPPEGVDKDPEELLLPIGEFGWQPSRHNRVVFDEVCCGRTGAKRDPFKDLSEDAVYCKCASSPPRPVQALPLRAKAAASIARWSGGR